MKILSDILSATILFSVPLLLVALGGMFSERSGIVNIALEGIMIVGALFASLTLRSLDLNTSIGTNAPQLGMLIAIAVAALSGAIFSLLLAFASISLKADQTIGGTALNMLAPAVAIAITWAVQGQGQTNIIIPTWARITQETLGITAKNTFLQNFLFKSFYLTTPIAILLFITAVILLYKTRFGLRLRACGEHPQAADSVGVNVYRMRYSGVFISGMLGGIGGLAYTLAAGSTFQSSVAGYGFPRPRGYDIRQLETLEHSRRVALLRAIQNHWFLFQQYSIPAEFQQSESERIPLSDGTLYRHDDPADPDE